jgi:hypothetical protein
MFERARPMAGKKFLPATNAGLKAVIFAGRRPFYVFLAQRRIVLFQKSRAVFHSSGVLP